MSIFDIQINGFGGVDFQSEHLKMADMRRAIDALARHGSTSFFPTLITDTPENLARKLARFEDFCDRDPMIASAIAGYHIEGPWISAAPGYCGAHDPAKTCDPLCADFDMLQKSARGRICLVTLAPERTGSAEFIAHITTSGVTVSLGHTNASLADIDSAVQAGARYCTHLGNGVPAELPRHDNIIQRLLSCDSLTAFFIPDGIHIPPFVLKNFVRAKGLDRSRFTTDAMSAASAPAGVYTLAHLTLEVGQDRIVRQPGFLNFAGSALTPDQALRNVCDWLALPTAEAQKMFRLGN